MDSKFMTPAEIKDKLRLPPSTVYAFIKSNLPHNRIGRRIIIEEKDFLDHLKRTKIQPKVTRKARF